MVDPQPRPPRAQLAPGLEAPRILTGLWQVADMERGGRPLDAGRALDALRQYAEAGFDAFDMADHYGSAEDLVGRLLAAPDAKGVKAFTKWCPAPAPMTREAVREGVGRSLQRLGVERIELLQFHWWRYGDPRYLDAMAELARLREEGVIGHLGVTNFDTDHLRLLVKHGLPVATNQVSFSLLDRRAAGRMSAFCRESGVRLLAYGTLGGGFLAERWLGRPEPRDIPDWSKSKYKRFIDAAGGWDVLQAILAAASTVARKHGVSIANVATRWVLEQAAVGAIVVGARLGESEHRADNLKAFAFSLDADDLASLNVGNREIPGDCGDEYRRPPYLTASGDLSHHLEAARPVAVGAGRARFDSGTRWEPIAGYSRAIRAGKRILVSGTTATHGEGMVVCPGDAEAQAVYVYDKIGAALEALGGRMEDVVRTRVYLKDAAKWEGVARVQGRVFRDIRPANTMLEAGAFIGDYELEIEAEAEVE